MVAAVSPGGITDPYALSVNGLAFPPHFDLTGKTKVDPRIDPLERTLVIITLGQSNAANHNSGSYSPDAAVNNISIENGGIYVAVEPLLGCTGPLNRYGTTTVYTSSSNFATRLADKLIDGDYCDRPILVPIAVADASIGDWAPGGPCNHRIGVAVARLAALGYSDLDTIILQCQGEKDNNLGTSAGDYETRCLAAIETFRDLGVDAPYFVSQTSRNGSGLTSADVRAGQAAVVDDITVFAGPDTDSLDGTYRYDGVHFNATGSNAVADLWLAAITPHLP